MGLGHSACTAKGGVSGFIRFGFVSHPLREEECVYTIGETQRAATHQENLCKGYVAKPCRLTLGVFEGLIDPRRKRITTCG
jgi:hypothetical protein